MAKVHLPAVMGFYDDPSDLMLVTERARIDEGFKNLDAYTPYPVHGIEEALGLKRSWVSTAARIGLLFGAFLGFMFQSWASGVSWPINIGGKPFVSWPAWIPITFESGVLLAGFVNLFSLFFAARLWPRNHTMVLSRRITNDRFVLLIPVSDEKEEARAIAFFERHLALKVKVVESIDKEKGRYVFRAATEPEKVAVS